MNKDDTTPEPNLNPVQVIEERPEHAPPQASEPPPPNTATGDNSAAQPAVSAESSAGQAAPGEGTAVAVPMSMLGRAIAELQDAQRAGHDRLLRLAADYDNYKKRSRKEQTDAVRRAEEKTILEFLPVIDNLERALSHAQAGEGAEAARDGGAPGLAALLAGVSMVHKQFLSVLERLGVKPFQSVGQPFDPERHEAIQQVASAEQPGIICQEAQRGYIRGDRLVRPALVVVSLGPVSTPLAAQPDKAAEGIGGGGDGSTSNSGES